MTTWAFIPARDGSRRFPQKNSAPFLGKPLVVWAVEIAREAQRIGLVDHVLVLTEGWSAGGVAPALEAWGVKHAPSDQLWVVARPEPLRRAEVRVIDLLRFYLDSAGLAESLGQAAAPPQAVCVLVPTSPLRTIRHLVNSYRLLTPQVDVVLSVTPFRQDVRGALVQEGDALLRCDSADWPVHKQYLKHDGSALWVRTEYVLSDAAKRDGFYGGRVVGYQVAPESSADIDYELDLLWAEFLSKTFHD